MNPHVIPTITQDPDMHWSPQREPLRELLMKTVQEPSYSEVVVREHIRRKPKVAQPKNKPKTKVVKKKTQPMDVATFKTIVRIQKDNMQMIKQRKKENPDPAQERRKQEWTMFMKKAAKQSRKSKGKRKSALRNAKRFEKERMERETEEWFTLREKLRHDESNFSDKEMLRLHYLNHHAILDERKMPGRVLRYDPRQGTPEGKKYRPAYT